MRRVGLVVLLAGLAVSGALGSPAMAEDPVENSVVTDFEATVRVAPDGELQVAESFRLDVGEQPHETLTRAIQTRVRFDDSRDQLYRVDGLAAAVDGEVSEARLVESDGGTVDLEIAPDSALEVGSTYTVTLDYRVRGAVSRTADGLELHWPVIQGLDYPVESASVGLIVPGTSWAACFAGPAGSSMPCTATQITEQAHPDFYQEPLAANSRMTIVVGIPDNAGIAADQELAQRWSFARAFAATPLTLGVTLAALVIALALVVALWWSRSTGERATRRDVGTRPGPDAGEVIGDVDGAPTFVPPDGVRPGEMGTVLNERADVVDIVASILDLAVRGYLTIEELPHSSTYARTEWRLHRGGTSDEAGLLQSERAILAALFADGRDEVTLTDLAHTLPGNLGFVQDRLYADVVTQRWFAVRPDAVRSRWSTAGVVLAGAGVMLTVVLAAVTDLGLIGFGIILAGALLTWAGQVIPSRTARGSQLLGRLRGFNEYVETAELNEYPGQAHVELAERILPYAVVFGFEERWVRVLADTDEDDTADLGFSWYRAPADWHLQEDFPESMHNFITTLTGAMSVSRRLGL